MKNPRVFWLGVALAALALFLALDGSERPAWAVAFTAAVFIWQGYGQR
ncbi:hypothetical protein [Deinococcus radiodurans]|jgi:hypothetical protein|nr:hypothetical protein [Deinococcus radiodurans]QIP28692.1 hypothetical protein HAV23_05465 [Deinococcus radiodurans]QIP32605.1 hypothetical protein HAV35_11345 [Deinococcus radiodurans]UID69517.1 hypothetical protein DRO_0512 [Deinococcus radiodurans R1 = ATCC 13939 = DSM 20539]